MAFSLIELLVVIGIIAVLASLLLAAIQSSREAGRRSACSNNLHQLGLAGLLHLDKTGHYPAGGWGGSWTGDPSRGYGVEQPGGWLYAVLEYLDHGEVRSLGISAQDDAEKRIAAAQAMATIVPTFACPSRRAATLYPMPWPYPLVNADPPLSVARSDYAMNAGDQGVLTLGMFGQAGPSSIADAASTYPWPATNLSNGVTYFRSTIGAQQVQDGSSKTYLVGEKYVSVSDYEDGQTFGDRGFALIGYSPDTVRMTLRDQPPRLDAEDDKFSRFGSAHPTTCGFVFCDGSVRYIAFDIDPELHRAQGNRRDQ